jgi:hypothetical protein
LSRVWQLSDHGLRLKLNGNREGTRSEEDAKGKTAVQVSVIFDFFFAACFGLFATSRLPFGPGCRYGVDL